MGPGPFLLNVQGNALIGKRPATAIDVVANKPGGSMGIRLKQL